MAYILEEELPKSFITFQIIRHREESLVPNIVRVKADLFKIILPTTFRAQEIEEMTAALISELIMSNNESVDESPRPYHVNDGLCSCEKKDPSGVEPTYT